MIIFTENINENLNLPKAIENYFSDCKVGVLDIETTGLSPSQHKVIIGGLLVFDCGNKGKLLQFFAENPSEEKGLLEAYIEEINKCHILITYNGKSFDLNFLKMRASKLGLSFSEFPYNLDLYLLIKKTSNLKNLLDNLKQKTIEHYLGLGAQRLDEISGGESIELYEDFVNTGNQQSKDKILLHNRDDLYQLYKLLKVVEICDMEKGFYNLGFLGTPNLQITHIKRGLHYLQIEGIQIKEAVSYYSFGDFGDSLQIAFDKKTRTFQIMVPVFQKEGIYFLDILALNFQDTSLAKSPYYESGFLIIEEKGDLNYKGINVFIKLLMKRIGKEIEAIK